MQTPLRSLPAFIIILILIGACANQVASSTATPPASATPAPLPSVTSDFVLTPVPGIAATVTAMHKTPPLSPEQARPYLEIKALVMACQEFHPNRRLAILQHIEWLLNPAGVPPEFISLYGDNVSDQLISGAAYTVAVEWKLGGRQANSCLIPIGTQLNALLVSLGRQPAPEFAN